MLTSIWTSIGEIKRPERFGEFCPPPQVEVGGYAVDLYGSLMC